jgi:hypothetical protein
MQRKHEEHRNTPEKHTDSILLLLGRGGFGSRTAA